MKIYADIRQEVTVNPKDVIEALINREIGRNGWIFINNHKYYRGFEVGRCDEGQEEISKETFEYVTALQLVLQRLKDSKGQ